MQAEKNNTASNFVAGTPLNSHNVKKFLDGSFRSEAMLTSAIIGYGTYHEGWKWSPHAGPQTGNPSVKHVGYILSGHMVIRDAAGIEKEVGPGQVFEVGPGHDAWVAGSEICTALDFTNIA